MRYIFLLLILPLFLYSTPDQQKRAERRSEILKKYESVALFGKIIDIDLSKRRLLVAITGTEHRVWVHLKEGLNVRYYGKKKAFKEVPMETLQKGWRVRIHAPFLFDDLERKQLSFMTTYELDSMFTYR